LLSRSETRDDRATRPNKRLKAQPKKEKKKEIMSVN
jgi:hypothetical protein